MLFWAYDYAAFIVLVYCSEIAVCWHQISCHSHMYSVQLAAWKYTCKVDPSTIDRCWMQITVSIRLLFFSPLHFCVMLWKPQLAYSILILIYNMDCKKWKLASRYYHTEYTVLEVHRCMLWSEKDWRIGHWMATKKFSRTENMAESIMQMACIHSLITNVCLHR